MRSFIKNILLSIVLTAFGRYVSAQDFKNLFREMKQQYDSMENFHIVMDIKASENAKAPAFYAETFDLKKEGANYLYSSKNNIMLMSNAHIVVVDKSLKQVMLSTRDRAAESQMSKSMELNMDSLLTINSIPELIGERRGKLMYAQHLKNGPVETVNMYIDPNTKVISRVEYYYRESQFVSVDFTLFDTTPTFDSNTFSETRMVTLENGKYKPSLTYKGFQLINADTN